MVEQEDRGVKPHEEETEVVNLDVREEKKEMKDRNFWNSSS